jgi:hypothetical protein
VKLGLRSVDKKGTGKTALLIFIGSIRARRDRPASLTIFDLRGQNFDLQARSHSPTGRPVDGILHGPVSRQYCEIRAGARFSVLKR